MNLTELSKLPEYMQQNIIAQEIKKVLKLPFIVTEKSMEDWVLNRKINKEDNEFF